MFLGQLESCGVKIEWADHSEEQAERKIQSLARTDLDDVFEALDGNMLKFVAI